MSKINTVRKSFCSCNLLFLYSILFFGILSPYALAGENWWQFRGPSGDGQTASTGLPLKWSETENVIWKTAIHDRGWSSPVIWGSQVWLTTATADGSFKMDIDRILPRQRPAEKIKGHQSWRNLAFLHWEVPVEELERLLPEGLQPDLFQGKAYVGLVPFEMKNIRPAWCPKALGFNFLETNVRTYVLHRNEPGVFFFSLDASSLTAVKIARWMWHLPYFHSGMTFSNERTAYEYGLKRPDNIQSKIKIEAGQPLSPSQPDSLEYFLLERYLLFTPLRGRILRGQVHHVPYPACHASLVDFEDQLLEVNGFTALNSSPDLVHFSTGVDVEIYSLKRTD